jgi:hypothetical protein
VKLRSLWSTLQSHPSGWLLAAQVLAILVHPLLESSDAGRIAFLVFGNVMLALTLWVVNRSPVVNWIGWLLAIPAVGLSLAAHFGGRAELLAPAHLLEAAVYFYAAVGLISYMLADHVITSDELLAAGATFTLLAWAFAFAFSAAQIVLPGCFSGAGAPGEPRTWLELLFLSFSTLSGVGLSDIVPLRAFARSLVMLEMFCGVMYIAIVVSRLIALASQRVRDGR